MNKVKEMKELEQLCRPVANYLKNNWDPHCTVVINDSQVKLVRDEIGISVGTAQEVPVREQFINKFGEKLNSNLPLYLKNLNVQEGSITHEMVLIILGTLAQVLKEL